MNSYFVPGRRAVLRRAEYTLGCLCSTLLAAEPSALPLIKEVPAQPLVAQARRLVEAASFTGAPFTTAEIAALESAFAATDDAETVEAIQRWACSTASRSGPG
jgi:hypothetical protein